MPNHRSHSSENGSDEIKPGRIGSLARKAFEGHLTRKERAEDLARRHPVPAHVAESLLGKRRAAGGSPEEAFEEADRILSEKTLRPGNEKLLKDRARREGTAELIDHVSADLGPGSTDYLAELSGLELGEVPLGEDLVGPNRRLLQDGLYAEVTLRCADPDEERSAERGSAGRSFQVEDLSPIEPSSADLLEELKEGRRRFSAGEWLFFLIQSIGLDPTAEALGPRAQSLLLLRLVPLAERNYNLVELGPRQTGKSYLHGQLLPQSHLLPGAEVTTSQLFYDGRTQEKGLVTSSEVICLDEIASSSVDDDVLSMLKEYMESGTVGYGKKEIQGEASMVLLGNADRTGEEILREGGHLFETLPETLRESTAFFDRLHAYLPGWELSKIRTEHHWKEAGLSTGFLAECLSRLRTQGRRSGAIGRVELEGNHKTRDERAIRKTARGLLKLLYPDPEANPSREVLRWAVALASESRLRVREQQRRQQSGEFEEGTFRFRIDGGPSRSACLPEHRGPPET